MLKNWFNEHKKIWIILWIFTILIIIWVIYFFIFWKNKQKSDIKKERISISDFSSEITIIKSWTLLNQPKIRILSDVNWTISSINVTEWTYVKEWKILMQIKNTTNQYVDELDDASYKLLELEAQYDELQNQYNKNHSDYSETIEWLKNQLSENETLLAQAILRWDTAKQSSLEEEIVYIENLISSLQINQQSANFDSNSELNDLKNQIQSVRNEYDSYYNKLNAFSPKATIDWNIWTISITPWDVVHDWDELLTIQRIWTIPEIMVELDLEEYLLIKDVSTVQIKISDNSMYEGKVLTRTPIPNENWKYEVIIEIIENIMDEEWEWKYESRFLEDWQTYNAEFSVYSDWIWLSERCFSKIWISKWTVKLLEWENEYEKELNFISKWNDWILVNNSIISNSDIKILCES